MVGAAENLLQLRRLLPVRLIPGRVQRRTDRLWRDAGFREHAEQSMEFLLGCSERAAEAPALARGYAEFMVQRTYLRWHPRTVTRQRVRDVEWLTTRRDPDRGVVLSFAHHGQYDGLFASLARHGVAISAVMTPAMMGKGAPLPYRQHHALIRKGAHIVPSMAGDDAQATTRAAILCLDLLRKRTILAIASDMPGPTPVTFLGRRVLGSEGASRFAAMTGSPVVVVTTRRDADGPYLQVHPPLEPADFADPSDLLAAVLDLHGEAVLAWPEAYESPFARFGVLEP